MERHRGAEAIYLVPHLRLREKLAIARRSVRQCSARLIDPSGDGARCAIGRRRPDKRKCQQRVRKRHFACRQGENNVAIERREHREHRARHAGGGHHRKPLAMSLAQRGIGRGDAECRVAAFRKREFELRLACIRGPWIGRAESRPNSCPCSKGAAQKCGVSATVTAPATFTAASAPTVIPAPCSPGRVIRSDSFPVRHV